MNQCKLDFASIYDFICEKNRRNSLATICAEDKIGNSICVDETLYIRQKEYSDEAYAKIISQSKDWEIKVVRTEDWGPSFGYTKGKVVTEVVQAIAPREVLVREDNFAGVLAYAHEAEKYLFSFALTDEFSNEPILFCSDSGFGSSDHDMMYTNNYYLQKKRRSPCDHALRKIPYR